MFYTVAVFDLMTSTTTMAQRQEHCNLFIFSVADGMETNDKRNETTVHNHIRGIPELLFDSDYLSG